MQFVLYVLQYLRKQELREHELHVGKKFNLSLKGRGQVGIGRGEGIPAKATARGKGTELTDVAGARESGGESSLTGAKGLHQERGR